MNPITIKAGLESGMLNYMDNETPRYYFLHALATEEELEKFAELIVRECIECINSTDKGTIFTTQSAGIVGAAHNRSVKKIKEHFGVE